MKNKSEKFLFYLGIIIVVFYIVNAIYVGLMLPNCPRSYAELMQFCSFNELSLNIDKIHYGHLYIWLCFLVMKLVGKNYFLFFFINNTLYLFLFIYFSYLLGKEMKEEKIGIITSIIVCLYPLFFSAYTKFSFDFPLAGIVVMNFYFLIKSKYFLDFKWSFVLTLSIIIGILMKVQIIVSLFVPLIYCFFNALLKLRSKNYTYCINFLLNVTVLLLFVIFFYGKDKFLQAGWYVLLFGEKTGIKWYMFENLKMFGSDMWISLNSLLFLPFFFVGLYYFVIYKLENKELLRFKILWLSGIFFPILVVLLMSCWKTERHLLQILPMMGFVSSFCIRKFVIKNNIILLFVLFIIGVVQLYDFTYDKIGLYNLKFRFLGKEYFLWHPDRFNQLPLLFSEIKNNVLEIEKISKIILSEVKEKDKKIFVVTFWTKSYSLHAFGVIAYFFFNTKFVLVEYPGVYIIKNLLRGLKTEKIQNSIDYFVYFKEQKKSDLMSEINDIIENNLWQFGFKKIENISAVKQKLDSLFVNFKEIAYIGDIDGKKVFLYEI